MERRIAALALTLVLLLPGVAGAASVSEIATALRSDPVFVEPEAAERLPEADRGRVRIRIAQVATGRIQVVVVGSATARRAGGVQELANAIDQAMPGRRGSLIVTNGQNFWIITSHAASGAAAGALRSAVEANEGASLAFQLVAAVPGIAAVDPGANADLNQNSGDDFVDDVSDAFRTGVLIVAIAIALPFLVGALWLLNRWRRRSSAEADQYEITKDDTRDRLVALGDQIQDLDLDVEMPGASAAGRADYDQAVAHFQRASRLFEADPSATELAEVRRAVEEGERCMAAAKAALTTPPAGV